MRYFNDTFNNFEALRQQQILCDATMIVEEKLFHAHKFLLASASEFFRVLFTIDMKERNQSHIKLQDMKQETFEQVISFIYTGKACVTTENLHDILHASTLLQMPYLKDLCCEFMQTNLTTENCLTYFYFADLYSCEKAKTNILNYFYVKTQKILTNSENICFATKQFIKNILSSDEVRISDESVLYLALVKWVKHDESARKQDFCDLLRYVRLPNMSNAHLHKIMGQPLVINCKNCRNYVEKSLQFQNSAIYSTVTEQNYHVRGLGQILVVDKKCQKFTTLSTRDGKYIEMTVPHIPMKSFFKSAVVCGSKLSLLGGMNKQQAFTCDFKHGKAWRELPSMTIRRNYSCGFCLTLYHRDKVYVIGGSTADRFLADVECYSDATNTWEVLPNMPTARADISAAAFGDCIFVMGGWNGDYLDVAECYDIPKRKWRALPPMPTERSCATAKCHNGQIYVIGGRNRSGDLCATEVYNPEKNMWTILPDINFSRVNLGVCASRGVLYVIGGDTGSKASSYEYWDEASEAWVPSNDINKHGYCRAFAILE